VIFRFTYFDEIYEKKVPTASTSPDLALSTEKMEQSMERLGHANISITLDTYSHVLPGLQEAAALRFEEGLQQVKAK
jgi:integrase